MDNKEQLLTQIEQKIQILFNAFAGKNFDLKEGQTNWTINALNSLREKVPEKNEDVIARTLECLSNACDLTHDEERDIYRAMGTVGGIWVAIRSM